MAINRNKTKTTSKSTTRKKTANTKFIKFERGGPGSQKELYDNIGHEYAPGSLGPAILTTPRKIAPTTLKVSKKKKKKSRPKSKVT